jgi:hypothetical protein
MVRYVSNRGSCLVEISEKVRLYIKRRKGKWTYCVGTLQGGVLELGVEHPSGSPPWEENRMLWAKLEGELSDLGVENPHEVLKEVGLTLRKEGGERLFECEESDTGGNGGDSRTPSRIETSLSQEELDGRAREFLSSPDLLHRIKSIMEKGVIADRYRFVLGEDDRKLLVFLIAASASTRVPQSLWVTGTTGFGKSNLVMVVLRLMPPGYAKIRSYITAGGIRYGDKDYRVLFLKEFRQSAEHDLRLSTKEDGGYIYEIAVKDPGTGEWTTQVEEIPAKTIITTSAGQLPNPQTLRRFWLLSVDESEELTEKINRRKAEYEEGKVKPADQDEVAVVQRAIQLLEPAEVVIPFAGLLLNLAPWDRTRLDNLYDIIKIIAWLHQYQRPRDREGRIVATPADCYMALRIAWPTLTQTLSQLPERLRKVLNVLPTDTDAYGKTVKEICVETKLASSTVRQYLSDLDNYGFILEDKRPDTRSKQYWRKSNVEALNSVEEAIQHLKWQEIASLVEKTATKPPSENALNCQQCTGTSSWGCLPAALNPTQTVIDPLTGEIKQLYPLGDFNTPQEEVEKGEISQKEAKIEELSVEPSDSTRFNTSTFPPKETQPKSSDGKNMSISEKGLSEPISLSDIHAAIGSFAGATVPKAKLGEEIGIPLDRLQSVIDELAKRGKLIDRGAFVEVIRP